MTKPVHVHVSHDLRSYLPWLRWDWCDNDEGYICLSFGNRHCDDLFGVTVTFKGRWLQRWGDWLTRREGRVGDHAN